MSLTDIQRELCESSPYDFSDLRALFVNYTVEAARPRGRPNPTSVYEGLAPRHAF
jgi:hypothetical protein